MELPYGRLGVSKIPSLTPWAAGWYFWCYPRAHMVFLLSYSILYEKYLQKHSWHKKHQKMALKILASKSAKKFVKIMHKKVFSRKKFVKTTQFFSAGCIKIWHQKLASIFSLGKKLMPKFNATRWANFRPFSRKKLVNLTNSWHMSHFHVKLSYDFPQNQTILVIR